MRVSEIPVRVAVAEPMAAEEPAERVSVVVLVAGFCENWPVTPLGRPAMVRVTGPLKPNWGATVTVLAAVAPGRRLISEGASLRAKVEAFTVIGRVVLAVAAPDVPVMVNVAVPGVAALSALRVRVVALADGLGENTAVTPLGRLEAVKETFPLKPYEGVM